MARKDVEKDHAYLKIADVIHDAIRRGDYEPGQRLPTAEELARIHGVGHSTAHMALKDLAASGLVEGHRGRGTFVAPAKQAFNPIECFTDRFQKEGRTVRTEIYASSWRKPHRDATRILGLKRDEKVWALTRRLYLDELCAAMDLYEIPAPLAHEFAGDTARCRNVVRTLEEELRFRSVHFVLTKVDLIADRFFRDTVGTKPGSTFYEIRRLVSHKDGILMMHYVALRTDKFNLDFSDRPQACTGAHGGDKSGIHAAVRAVVDDE